MTQQPQTIFFVSDSTGITVETLAHSLLSQFSSLVLNQVSYRYIDTPAKAMRVREVIDEACRQGERPPLVLTTIVDPEIRKLITGSSCQCFDLFDVFLEPVSKVLGHSPRPVSGRSHGVLDDSLYTHRMEAVNFALRTDDGIRTQDYGQADVILVGVSRSGKTPSSLFMALHYDLFVANYPFVDEDLEGEFLPEALLPHRDKLFGLLLSAERLHRIRSERRPGSEYASLARCQQEIRRMESLLRSARIPCLDVTSKSVEEIATSIIAALDLRPPVYIP